MTDNYKLFRDNFCDKCMEESEKEPDNFQLIYNGENENPSYLGYKYYCPHCHRLKDDGSDAKKDLIEKDTAHSLPEFLAKIEKEPHVEWFRGVSNTNYPLKSVIGRLDIGEKINTALKKEYRLFSEFKRYISYLENSCENEDIAFIGQHYKLPTRLLDWTSSPLVALYFATKNKENDGAVYILGQVSGAPKGFTYESMLADGAQIEKSDTYLVIPRAMSSRMITQSGVFTIQTDPFIPLTKEVRKKIIIPQICKEKIFADLDRVGIHDFSLFPDKEGLAGWLREKYWLRSMYDPMEDLLWSNR